MSGPPAPSVGKIRADERGNGDYCNIVVILGRNRVTLLVLALSFTVQPFLFLLRAVESRQLKGDPKTDGQYPHTWTPPEGLISMETLL